MICPVCGYDNIQGADECENCGSDLRTADIPAPGSGVESRLVEQPLSTLAATPPLVVAPDDGLAATIARMQQAGVGVVVVEQGGQVRGILTERDLLLRSGPDLDGRTVAELMTADPVVLRPDDSIAVAIHKMAVGGFRHVPLVENGHATAVVSAGDVFRYILDIID